MVKKKYPAFTLIEMLIVMGILSVLMAIGVAVARFAIQRANNIQHQSAVDQMFQALQSHYTDHRRYPSLVEFDDFTAALDDTNNGVISQYVDANFDGGAPARYWYVTSSDEVPQEFLVCVSYAQPSIAVGDEGLGGYCNGNGFGVLGADGALIVSKTMDQADFDSRVGGMGAGTFVTEDWDGDKFDGQPGEVAE